MKKVFVSSGYSKLMSRNVIVDGKNIGLSIITIDNFGKVIEFEPFAKEIAGVRYIDKPIEIEKGELLHNHDFIK